MNKDQIKGIVIFTLCIIFAIAYAILLVTPQQIIDLFGLSMSTETLHFWLIAIPTLIIFFTVMAIGAWIGLELAKAQPPKVVIETESESHG
ncbi:MAG: hypothetical protein JSV51_08645 [Candidatus Bathyarchaeota archaeon]|nr:MAG: hypothetical protein JSV51_08645 [Candidatus Bathyarchaeota archaeon]